MSAEEERAEEPAGEQGAEEREGAKSEPDTAESYADIQELRSQGRAHLDGDFDGIMVNGDGPSTYIEKFVVSGGRRARVVEVVVGGDRVRAEQRTYHRVDHYADIASGLKADHVVGIFDAPGQGRRTTAVNLLAERVDPDRVRLLVPGEGIQPADLCDERAELFESGRGYLLDLTGWPVDPLVVDALVELLAKLQAYLVVLGDRGHAAHHQGPNVFRHPPPNPLDVLHTRLGVLAERHVAECVGGCTPDRVFAYLERCLADADLARELEFRASPRVVVQFAQTVVHGACGNREPAELTAKLPDRLRQAAVEALREPGAAPDEPHRAPLRQAVLAGYAVFHGRPLAEAFEASTLLCHEILPRFETRAPGLDRAVFDSNLSELISHIIVQDGPDGSEGPKLAEFVAPSFSRIVLDVVWHDFVSTRAPVVAWLDVLAGHDREPMRVRAAQAAGLLARYDFDEIHRRLLRHWARGNARYRDSTALALEMTASSERLFGRVCDLIRSWAEESADSRLQDCAARAYGTVIGARLPSDALRALRRLAAKPDLARSAAISVALARLFAASAHEQVLDALGDWRAARDRTVRLHAVRAMLILTRAYLGSDEQQALPALVAAREDWQDTLVELWRVALIGRETAGRAWQALHRWLLDAEDGGRRDLVESLAARVFAPPVAVRAAFHLDLWSARDRRSALLARLRAQIRSTDKGRTDRS
ncbi:hypothetical protein [Saccharothrix australiensis]|uniref:Uncharacterized protein n=1 Tax=Saccharothrix australiensis TaxID=2072 RepID=A0A495W368_9PSEU|nr:hypothetical protein [Saccharothrix australiensis]RKT54258.1 hypothetical protein C8E97_2874 [Saccharothrix australiensis]